MTVRAVRCGGLWAMAAVMCLAAPVLGQTRDDSVGVARAVAREIATEKRGYGTYVQAVDITFGSTAWGAYAASALRDALPSTMTPRSDTARYYALRVSFDAVAFRGSKAMVSVTWSACVPGRPERGLNSWWNPTEYDVVKTDTGWVASQGRVTLHADGRCEAYAAPKMPPVRPLGPVTHVSPKGRLGSVSMARPLSNGGVIINDVTRRQLVLFDSTLTNIKTIADASPTSTNMYASPMAGLLAYRGDSSLFIEMQSLSMLVIDPQGDVARVMALPSTRDAMFMVGGPFGIPGLDPMGRIVFRGAMFRAPTPASGAPASGAPAAGTPSGLAQPQSQFADSAPVYRFDMASRTRETLGHVTVPKQQPSMLRDKAGRTTGLAVLVNPMTLVDEWALLPDGRVAIVRGADYHVDWLELDGRWVSTPKIPYNWERLDDDAKQRVLDSTRVVSDKTREALQKAIEANPADANRLATGAGLPGVMVISTNPEGGLGRPIQQMLVPITNVVDAKYVADYRPAFRMGAVRSDTEGNLWVRTTAPTDGGAIYDVINGKGQLIDRVKLPFGRVIAGFAAGVVYMGVEDEGGARLERARVRP